MTKTLKYQEQSRRSNTYELTDLAMYWIYMMGDNLLHQSPKFYNNVFLFVGLKTLGTLVNFDWLIH